MIRRDYFCKWLFSCVFSGLLSECDTGHIIFIIAREQNAANKQFHSNYNCNETQKPYIYSFIKGGPQQDLRTSENRRWRTTLGLAKK